MIAIDTNHLLRLFVEKDHIQSHKAKKLVVQHNPVFISVIVLCETMWTLETRYHFTKKELILCIETILKAQQFNIEHREALWVAFSDFQHGAIGFADCIIGVIGKQHGCDFTATFDKKAAKSRHFKLTS
ncbi:MAG: hypothetical protein A3E82_06675 [Gammaproteobacteria bacterium RIFCSPHIGHO2_12_FULL_38_11]|nr:MAG: hypothetical protein A3E82_06675 [Gammaproteobacteria bacterium RIFCSPHIGHO2_12_FULL_38_11]